MSEEVLVANQQQGLGEFERVADTFVAPSATFQDIRRSASWWLPFLLIALFSTAATYTIDRHVGFSRVAENQVQASPSQAEQLAALTPEDRASQMEKRTIGTKYFSYALP